MVIYLRICWSIIQLFVYNPRWKFYGKMLMSKEGGPGGGNEKKIKNKENIEENIQWIF